MRGFEKPMIQKQSAERRELADLEKSGLYMFHGSPKELEELEPHEAHDLDRGSEGDPAIYASPSADYAIFMAVAKRFGTTGAGTHSNPDGSYRILFSATRDVLNNLDEEATGWVYVLPKEGFVPHNGPAEFKNEHPLTPIKKIRVSRRDLPPITQMD